MTVMASINTGLKRFYEDGGPRLHVVAVCAIQGDPEKGIIVASGLPPDLTLMLLKTAVDQAERGGVDEWVEKQ